MAVGVFRIVPCQRCGEECHPNAGWSAFRRPWLHVDEYARWKAAAPGVEPPGGWRRFDHLAKP